MKWAGSTGKYKNSALLGRRFNVYPLDAINRQKVTFLKKKDATCTAASND